MKVKRHFDSNQAKVAHLEMLTDAIKSGEWMATVWEIKDGKVEVCKTAWNFPQDAIGPALQKLRDLLAEEKVEKADPPVPEPLEIGKPFFKPPVGTPLEELGPPPGMREVGGLSGEPLTVPERPAGDDDGSHGPLLVRRGDRPQSHAAFEQKCLENGVFPDALPRRPESDDGKIRLEPMGEPSDGKVDERAGPLDGVQGGDEKVDEGGEDGRPVFEDLPPELRTAEEEKKPTGG